ncbi:MAG: class I SAM-dependent methyltransferase [Phycisphaerae bacterium]|nr:class I SAM-dependent methyltransferase [Phycisphaerae bacterium]
MDVQRPTPSPDPTLSSDYQRDWPAYFEAVSNKPPRETLMRALNSIEIVDPHHALPEQPLAIDLGCGEGRDTRALLGRNGAVRWTVTAIDSSPVGLSKLAASLDAASAARVWPLNLPLEHVSQSLAAGVPAAPNGSLRSAAVLVNASFALPFCDPKAFPALWTWIRNILAPGGRFAGQLFGDRDSWAPARPASHYTRAAAIGLMLGFDLELFDEVEKDGEDAMGGRKHHHVFHIVARKPFARIPNTDHSA